MIRHVLLFRFYEGVGDELQQLAVDKLRQLGEQCPSIDTWSVGINIADSVNAYDVIEIGDFASLEALDEYKSHPAHEAFRDFITPLASRALLDYEVAPVRPAIKLDLSQILDISPVTLRLNGAKYRRRARYNDAYRELRDNIGKRLEGDLTPVQLGRVVKRLVDGRVPKGLFEYNEGKSLTFNGIKDKSDLLSLQARVGAITASNILQIFNSLTSTERF